MNIAIISPATEVKPLYIDGAIAQLRRLGFGVRLMPHAKGPAHGTFASTDALRLSDLCDALTDPEVDAILCARGGYGCVHLLHEDLERLVRRHPKCLIGFSDISALHALWLKAGVPSIHASMAKQLALFDYAGQSEEIRRFLAPDIPEGDLHERLRYCCLTMLELLQNPAKRVEYVVPQLQYAGAGGKNIPGEVEGRIVGGNLAVLNGLAATGWDILSPEYAKGRILFLEDVGEKIYQAERMLTRLYLAGTLHAASGLVFGTFTDYRPDRNFPSMEAMITYRLRQWGVECPVAMGVPIGHQAYNLPIVEGARCRLSIPADPKRSLRLILNDTRDKSE